MKINAFVTSLTSDNREATPGEAGSISAVVHESGIISVSHRNISFKVTSADLEIVAHLLQTPASSDAVIALLRSLNSLNPEAVRRAVSFLKEVSSNASTIVS